MRIWKIAWKSTKGFVQQVSFSLEWTSEYIRNGIVSLYALCRCRQQTELVRNLLFNLRRCSTTGDSCRYINLWPSTWLLGLYATLSLPYGLGSVQHSLGLALWAVLDLLLGLKDNFYDFANRYLCYFICSVMHFESQLWRGAKMWDFKKDVRAF